MDKVNPSIFKAYDIRGVYGKDFDDSFAVRLGEVLARHFGGALVIGHDGRQSSDALERALIQGVAQAGYNVTEIGETSTPLFYFSVHAAGAAGGIMATASHNPGEYNGFKVIDASGAFIGGHELQGILQEVGDMPASQGSGSVKHGDFTNAYIDAIVRLTHTGRLPFTLGIQAPPGVQKIFYRLGERFGIRIVQECKNGLCISLDPDGDRISFSYDGEDISPDALFLLVAHALRFNPIVYSATTSRAVKEYFQEHSVRAILSPVGRAFIRENMERYHAAFGGESSGHYFFGSLRCHESPALMLVYVLSILQASGKNLKELTDPYHPYAKAPEITVPVRDDAFRRLQDRYHDGDITWTDGITVEYPAWWLNLRTSNTEPIMRLTIEAKTKNLLNQKVDEVRDVLGL